MSSAAATHYAPRTTGDARMLGRLAALVLLVLASLTTASLAQDAVFIESANALTQYVSLQSPPILKDKSAGTEKTDGRIVWHPALNGQKGILFASFESGQASGWYLRSKADELVVEKNDGTSDFARDASFKVKFDTGGSMTLESIGRPGFFIRKRMTTVVLAAPDQTATFEEDTHYFRVSFDNR